MSIRGAKFMSGPLLITRWSMSGPAILKLSRRGNPPRNKLSATSPDQSGPVL
ncbi:MAG: hypothetical protein ACOCTO_00325 [Marinilabiliaceae bacterium]